MDRCERSQGCVLSLPLFYLRDPRLLPTRDITHVMSSHRDRTPERRFYRGCLSCHVNVTEESQQQFTKKKEKSPSVSLHYPLRLLPWCYSLASLNVLAIPTRRLHLNAAGFSMNQRKFSWGHTCLRAYYRLDLILQHTQPPYSLPTTTMLQFLPQLLLKTMEQQHAEQLKNVAIAWVLPGGQSQNLTRNSLQCNERGLPLEGGNGHRGCNYCMQITKNILDKKNYVVGTSGIPGASSRSVLALLSTFSSEPSYIS